MPGKITTALLVLLVFGSASAALADTEDPTSLLRPAPARNSAFRAGSFTAGMMVWIRLTEPGGKRIHINVEHVTSVRSDTQIPGARTQLDLTSGKFQGVQEDAEQVMQLIAAGSARAHDEAAAAPMVR